MTNPLQNTVLTTETAKLEALSFGDLRVYFDGPTELLKAMTTGSVVLLPGEQPHPPHLHPEEEFMLVTEGTGEIFVDGTTHQVGSGAMMYCAANKLHGIKNTGSEPMTFFYHKWL